VVTPLHRPWRFTPWKTKKHHNYFQELQPINLRPGTLYLRLAENPAPSVSKRPSLPVRVWPADLNHSTAAEIVGFNMQDSHLEETKPQQWVFHPVATDPGSDRESMGNYTWWTQHIDNLFNLKLHMITVYDSFSTANLRYPLQFFISSRVFRCCRFRHTWMWMDVIGFWWVHKPRTTKKLTTTGDDIYIYMDSEIQFEFNVPTHGIITNKMRVGFYMLLWCTLVSTLSVQVKGLILIENTLKYAPIFLSSCPVSCLIQIWLRVYPVAIKHGLPDISPFSPIILYSSMPMATSSGISQQCLMTPEGNSTRKQQ